MAATAAAVSSLRAAQAAVRCTAGNVGPLRTRPWPLRCEVALGAIRPCHAGSLRSSMRLTRAGQQRRREMCFCAGVSMPCPAELRERPTSDTTGWCEQRARLVATTVTIARRGFASSCTAGYGSRSSSGGGSSTSSIAQPQRRAVSGRVRCGGGDDNDNDDSGGSGGGSGGTANSCNLSDAQERSSQSLDVADGADAGAWDPTPAAPLDIEPHESASGRRRRELAGEALGADGWLPEGCPHPASLPLDALAKECRVVRTRRGGPGGQHRNKVSTAVVLTHEPTWTTAEASERRSQAQNHKVAVTRLRVALALRLRRRPAATTDGGAAWAPGPTVLSRCGRKGTLQVSADHVDFAAVLADLLDGFAACGWRLSFVTDTIDSARPASHRPVRRNDVVVLLAKHAPALQLVNRRRLERDLPPLKRQS